MVASSPATSPTFAAALKQDVYQEFCLSLRRTKAEYVVQPRIADWEDHFPPDAFWESAPVPLELFDLSSWNDIYSIAEVLEDRHLFSIPGFLELFLRINARWAELSAYSLVDVSIASSEEVPLSNRRLRVAQRLKLVDAQSFLRNKWLQYTLNELEAFFSRFTLSFDDHGSVGLGFSRRVSVGRRASVEQRGGFTNDGAHDGPDNVDQDGAGNSDSMPKLSNKTKQTMIKLVDMHMKRQLTTFVDEGISAWIEMVALFTDKEGIDKKLNSEPGEDIDFGRWVEIGRERWG